MNLSLDFHIRQCLNYLERNPDPAQSCRPYFDVYFLDQLSLRGNVPTANHSAWDFGDVGSRFARSLINARKALGLAEASETEKRLQSLLFSCFGDDGLIHRPPSSRVDWNASSEDMHLWDRGQYWGIAERFTRNHLVETQHTDAAAICAHCAEEPVTPTPAEAGGDFESQNIFQSELGQTKSSHAGYTIESTREIRKLRVRIPDWLAVTSEIRANAEFELVDRCLIFDALPAGVCLEISFPLRDERLSETLSGDTYEVHWRGNTVVDLAAKWPRVLPRIPLYKHRAKVN